MGKIYLVGAGPGDPKLITVKGRELIENADCLIYDYLANEGFLSCARKGAELIYVGKQASRHEMSQQEINALLVAKSQEHDTVVRLKGGDPYIFGRGGEEALFLADHGVNFEVVPGVTSAIAVPAYAGIPLTHRGYASTVAFVTGHEDERKTVSTIKWHELANGPDTLVFLMGMKHLKDIKERLIREGRDPKTDSCIIQWGTLSKQKVVTGPLKHIDRLAEEAGIKSPGIILVGRVVSLREKLNWFEKRPLFGMTVAVTRAPHQSKRLGELLAEKGAEVVYIPTIDIVPIEPNKRLGRVLDDLTGYFCVIFTSVNGASLFLDNLFKKGKDARALGDVKVLAIGSATGAFLKGRGLVPDYVPEDFTQEGIIALLDNMEIKGLKFLIPRAYEARNTLTRYIRKRGASCDVIPVYKTALPENPGALTQIPDVITFTSSSTVRNFIALYGKDGLQGSRVASIGPITTETLRGLNINVDVTASQYDIAGLVDAIVQDALRMKSI